MPMSVHVIVSELDFFEGDDLLSELFACERWIRMDVEPGWRRRIRLSGHQPAAPMICVSIPLVVNRHDVHQDRVSTVRLQSVEWNATCRKHSSAQTQNILLVSKKSPKFKTNLNALFLNISKCLQSSDSLLVNFYQIVIFINFY